MIIVSALIKTNKVITPEHRKQQAIGLIDEYGNPFRIISLRWNKSRLHKNTDYAKTRGFEDTIITKERGEMAIKYRKNGSIAWMRYAGEGPYMGELAVTPKNLQKLASCYGDKLFTILDKDIDNIVKQMYEDKVKGMDALTKHFNDQRVRMMHTTQSEVNEMPKSGPVEIPVEAERVNLAEQNRLQQIEKQNLEKRKAALDAKEAEIDEKTVKLVGEGVPAVTYTKEYLAGLKGIHSARKICRELKVEFSQSDKKDDLINKIIARQTGEIKAVKEQMAGVIGGGLDD